MAWHQWTKPLLTPNLEMPSGQKRTERTQIVIDNIVVVRQRCNLQTMNSSISVSRQITAYYYNPLTTLRYELQLIHQVHHFSFNAFQTHTNWWTGQNKVVSQRVNLISNSANSLLIIITPCQRGRISNTVLLRWTQEREVERIILYLLNVRNQNQTQNRLDSSLHHSVHSDACLRLHPSNSPTNKIQKHMT